MAVDRLSLYNGALRECRERRLASLSEEREPRRLLDDVWNAGDGVLKYVLRAKQWRFARRTVMLEADPDITPSFGYPYGFTQPDDWLRTCKLCTDERLDNPLLQYELENGVWYTDVDPIYLSYVSNDADYGGDLTKWPPDFVLWVETHMASLIVGKLTSSRAAQADLLQLAKMRLKKAANTDAMEGPTQFAPTGSFVRARMGRSGLRGDRGSRQRLIG